MKRTHVRYWLILGIIAIAAGLGAHFIGQAQELGAEMRNEHALAAEAGLAILLALGFYRIQNQNNVRRKRFWLVEAQSQIKNIIDTHRKAIESCNKVMNDTTGFAADRERTNLKGEIILVERWYIPKLERAMTQMADLLDEPAIFAEVTHDNYNRFKDFLYLTISALEGKVEIQTAITSLERIELVFSDYIKRLEDEMPDNLMFFDRQ